MDIFYNYIYLDPRKPGKFGYKKICFLYEPIYVGKGKDNRMYKHISYFKNKKMDRINKIFYNKLNKIYSSGNEPYIIYLNEQNSEELCYNLEKYLILEIGTISGESPKRGPLCNLCVDNRPPNHKGKTYEEIYGEIEAQNQIKKRTQLQRSVGGYFKGRKHSEETLSLLSKIQSGKGNGMYGKKQKKSTKDKISKANKGRLSKIAKTYIFISPNGEVYKVLGNYIKEFCNYKNISYGALYKRINTFTSTNYGKSKNWFLFHSDNYINNDNKEIISYTVGALKQDLDDQDFSDFDI